MAGKVTPTGPTGDTVRQNIEELRQSAGLSYAEMSRQLEALGRAIPPLGLRRIEAGERRVDVDDLTAIAVVLEVSPVRLLMPSVTSTAIMGEATGTGERSTQDLWTWALGYSALDKGKAPAHRFRSRSDPRRVMTRKERIAARQASINSRIAELEREIECARLEHDEPGIGTYIAIRQDMIGELQSIDIEDDRAFEDIGETDPAPPSPEEIAGLLDGGDDNA